MVNPHQDSGVPWTFSKPKTTTTATTTGTTGGAAGSGINFGSGTGTTTTTTSGDGDKSQAIQTAVQESIKNRKITEQERNLQLMKDLAAQHGQQKKYSKAWKYNPKNPNNLLVDGKIPSLHTLGSFIAVDSSGRPMLDSSGNPIYTTFGKHIYDKYKDTGIGSLNTQDLKDMESTFWRNYTAPGGGGGYKRPTRNILDEKRAMLEQLWYGPRQSPQRAMEEQGFFDTMVDPYAQDITETLEKGLYSKSLVHPGAGVLPWGMEKIWATGRAKGGIVSLVGE